MFIVVDKKHNHSRILFRNNYYYILDEIKNLPCDMGVGIFVPFQHKEINTAIKKILNPIIPPPIENETPAKKSVKRKFSNGE